jgi:23S rRNA (uracil1939-C5)-methyltransferase
MSRKNPLTTTTPITAWSSYGYGKGSYTMSSGEECDVEIPYTMPGDVATIEIRRAQKAFLKEVITSSPQRLAPRCPHYTICGGCRYQHIPYSMQSDNKVSFIKDLFPEHHPVMRPFICCDSSWHYRNKMDFTFSNDKKGTLFLGLMMPNYRGKVVNIISCSIVDSWFTSTLEYAREWWLESGLQAYRHHCDKGSLRSLTLRRSHTTGDTMAILTVSGNPEYALTQKHLDSLVEKLSPMVSSIFVTIQQIKKGSPTQFFEWKLYGSDTITETFSRFSFDISPSAFFQPNSLQAEKLFSEAIALLDPSPDDIVYDLYCGIGTLGTYASPYVKKVYGIELCAAAALDARENIKKNGITNMEIFTGDTGALVTDIEEKPSAVIVDPPRSGLDNKTLSFLKGTLPPKILYISCNPKTQKDNVEALMASGYVVTAIQPVDQFPHTPHLENIVLLTHNTSL